MKGLWFKAQPVGTAFFDDAPVVLRDAIQIARPASEVWHELTMDGTLAWCRILDKVEWTSPRPFRVGTSRAVSSLKGTNRIQEHYFRWEEGKRKSFYVFKTSAPLFTHFAEDYLVEPTGPDACTFTWTIAYAPKRGTRATTPVNKRLLKTLFTDTRKHYGAN